MHHYVGIVANIFMFMFREYTSFYRKVKNLSATFVMLSRGVWYDKITVCFFDAPYENQIGRLVRFQSYVQMKNDERLKLRGMLRDDWRMAALDNRRSEIRITHN